MEHKWGPAPTPLGFSALWTEVEKKKRGYAMAITPSTSVTRNSARVAPQRCPVPCASMTKILIKLEGFKIFQRTAGESIRFFRPYNTSRQEDCVLVLDTFT